MRGSFVFLLLAWVGVAQAAPVLPAIWSDGAVIQSGQPVRIWGKAAPGERIAVSLGPASGLAVASREGRWEAVLPPLPPANEPVELSVRGQDGQRSVQDILVGEVWVAAGQSNMEYPIEYADEGFDAFIDVDQPHIRFFVVEKRQTLVPQEEAAGRWVKLTPRAAPKVSAVGFFFARELSARTGRAVGMVQASYGGTPIEAWTPRETIEAPGYDSTAQAAWRNARDDELRRRRHSYAKLSTAWSAADAAPDDSALASFAPPSWPEQTATARMATVLYNAMLHPIRRYAAAGMIWYQGETNRPDGTAYGPKLRAFLNALDERWGRRPVGIVQTAPLAWPVGGDPEDMPQQWQAQADVAKARSGTGLIPTLDTPDRRDIHPRRKRFIGERLAWWAAGQVYGLPAPAHIGPMLRGVEREELGYRIRFDHADGLRSRGGIPTVSLEGQLPEGGWRALEARIEGDTLVVAHSKSLTALRYQWTRDAQPDLMNAAGVPAWPFLHRIEG